MTSASNTFVYMGKSMWPCFQEHDLLVVTNVTFEEIRVGDCIGYQTPVKSFAVHRVVAKHYDYLLTRGDAMLELDNQKIQKHQITGRISKRYRFNKCSNVTGGSFGHIAGILFRYAGRIDPERQSRGGHIARAIRAICSRLLRTLQCNGRSHSMVIKDNETLKVWKFGGQIVARHNSQTADWRIAWPWTLILDDKNCK